MSTTKPITPAHPAPCREDGQPWPDILPNNRAIAAVIAELASDYVDEDFAAEYFFGRCARLRWVPIEELQEGNPDTNQRSRAKERRYAKLDQRTAPPLVVEDGVIKDGGHRFRVGKAAGAAGFWCYDVLDEPAPAPTPAA